MELGNNLPPEGQLNESIYNQIQMCKDTTRPLPERGSAWGNALNLASQKRFIPAGLAHAAAHPSTVDMEKISQPLHVNIASGTIDKRAAYGLATYFNTLLPNFSLEDVNRLSVAFPPQGDIPFEEYKRLCERNGASIELVGSLSPQATWNLKRSIIDILEINNNIQQRYKKKLKSHPVNDFDSISLASEVLKKVHMAATQLGVKKLTIEDSHLLKAPHHTTPEKTSRHVPHHLTRRRMLGIAATSVAATLGLWGITRNGAEGGELPPPTKTPNQKTHRTPTPRSADIVRPVTVEGSFFNNGEIGIGKSGRPGIMDIYYKDRNTGKWVFLNNALINSTVKGNSSISEIEEKKIETSNHMLPDGTRVIRFQFEPANNGAHYFVDARIPTHGSNLEMQFGFNEDSAPISNIDIAQCAGFVYGIHTLEVNGRKYDSRSPEYAKAPRSAYKGPDAVVYPANVKPGDQVHIRYWGPDGRTFTYSTNQPFAHGDEIRMGLRNETWERGMNKPPYQWWESFAIAKGSALTDTVWTIGVERS